MGAVLNMKISAPESLATTNRNVWTLAFVAEIPGTIRTVMTSSLSFVRKQKWGSRIRIKVLSMEPGGNGEVGAAAAVGRRPDTGTVTNWALSIKGTTVMVLLHKLSIAPELNVGVGNFPSINWIVES